MSAQPAFSLQQYCDVLADGIGIAGADYTALAAAHGIDKATWERGMADWGHRMQHGGGAAKLVAEFTAQLTASLEKSIGPMPPVSLDTYVEISAHGMAGRPLDPVLAAHDLDMRRFTLAGYQWKAHGDADKRLEVYMALRTQKRIAELTHRAARSQFAVVGPGNLVRARHCGNCGALKATKPTTAYVYCDYCAMCFDYDSSIEFRDGTSLDNEDVDAALVKAVAPELRAAFAAGDREQYARVYRWIVDVTTELCPLAYSPRIKDPEYRKRFIDDLIVPWRVITTFDEKSRADADAFKHAYQHAIREPKLGAILALYKLSRAAWEYEVQLFEREGLFARHPDGFTPEMYLHVNASVFVRPWLAVLNAADQQALLHAANQACDYIPAPNVAFSACGCGKCGAQLQVAAGAKRVVCEACGHVLDVGERQFPCRQCGAPLALSGSATDVVCGACNARWVR